MDSKIQPIQDIKFPLSHILRYALIMAILVFVLKWLQWKYLIVDNAIDIYVGLIAVFFTILGIWLATQLTKPKVEQVIVEKEVYVPLSEDFAINQSALEALNLTKREFEILQLISSGHSNAEIADNLFLSLSTVKTHLSNLYVKMDVKRRTQAVDRAKKLQIVP
ncbi:Response regulator LiaR [Indibacter alkaliphilus LW1]|uniref:Response regulator LiaR n=1 Tax=Indibacter alkaliphilus (strain CCUG 57479 / KCTC 22604 / LW1) TaxID=1189612 RepID=S2DIU9_INDAL|nr:response regulator transcription factor [Indibacter alkaliphilus]EOZ97125.1 Response regulator LiaR [Indibacter alkaliphilus LW1]